MYSPTALGAKAQSKVLADLAPSGGREKDSAPLSLLPPGANPAGPCLVDTDSCICLHLHVLPVSQYPGPLSPSSERRPAVDFKNSHNV